MMTTTMMKMMSAAMDGGKTVEFKDARELLVRRGPEALRAAVLDVVPCGPQPVVERDGQSGGLQGQGGQTREKPQPFAFLRADAVQAGGEPLDFVEDLLTEGGASVIYGPSNCGKSFWVVDLGVCVATGEPFRDDLAVDRGAVIYVALEGAFGTRNRIQALRKSGRLGDDAPFYLIFDSISLLEQGHAARLAETVSAVAAHADLPVKLVILDTMARAMAGGDENSGQDMTAAVQSIDAVRAATGAHVAVVHHCGKDEARGARGHSSLRAAVDTEIEVSRPAGESISTVRVTKQRDLPAREAMPFSLKVVELGTGRRGKPLTSCIVQHEDEEMAAEPRGRTKPGRKPICPEGDLLALLPATTVMWRIAAMERFGISRATFYAAKVSLESDGKVVLDEASKRYFSKTWAESRNGNPQQSECAELLAPPTVQHVQKCISGHVGFPDDP